MIDEGLLYTWGDVRKQPYGLPSALAATEVATLTSVGKVYG